MREAVIVSACRTPVGSFGGTLKDVTARELGATVIREAVKRANIKPEVVDEVIFGCVLQGGLGQNISRQCALDAGVAFINSMPVFIVSNDEWAKKFEEKGIPIVGDDIKAQIGATITHRTLANLFRERGVKLERTYQLNTGGNTDFLNMLNRSRLDSKKESKTEAVQSVLGERMDDDNIHIGPSDYVPWQKDNKLCFLRMEGKTFGDVPMNIELRLSVEDSPNSAGCVIDAIRCGKLALERGIGGYLTSISAYTMKHPPEQFTDDVAVEMVEQCPALKQRIRPMLSQKRLIYKPLGSFYQVLSAEAYTKHGLNVHGVVFDELHAQPNRQLYDVMMHGSGDARKQPLFFLITTAGTDRHSICWEVHSKAQDIIEGRKVDPTFYPVIYGASEDADWTSEKVWKQTNPSLGITVDIEKLRAACENAKQNPAEENLFRQLRLNQWVKQSIRWMPMAKWDACAFPVDPESLRGRTCYGGLDLSSTTDITAFVLVFPPLDEDDKFQILPFFWIPEDNIGLRVRRDHVPYDTWAKQGFVYTTEGNVVHYGFIEEFIDELGAKYNIREIAFDRWGAVQMVQNLEGLGFTVVPFGQGFKDMSPPTKELMRLTLEEKLAHGGHPVLRWMVDNIFVRTDPAGNIKPDKEKSTEKIDGAVATIMALDRAIRNLGSGDGGSVYSERGLLIL